MTPLPLSTESFQETFCAQYGVAPELYGVTVLRLTLYPHARWLADLGPQSFLGLDRAFVVNVGRLTRWRGFGDEAREFQRAPGNQHFWRRHLCLRISVERMRALFSEVMGGTAAPPASLSPSPNESDEQLGSLGNG